MATPAFFGTEFLVNTTTSDNQQSPTITGLANGRFVVSWDDLSETGGDPSAQAIRAQIFNADGSASGAEFLVNSSVTTSQLQPSISGLANGGFVVSWTDYAQVSATSGAVIRAQIFYHDGTASGAEILVNSTGLFHPQQPTITGLADGGFVVTWYDFRTTGDDTSGTAIRAQVHNADGTAVGSEFLVNSTTAELQFSPTITELADGRFVISWADNSATGADTSGYAIRAQVFNDDGSKSGSEFLVNTAINSDQIQPDITGLIDGRFVVSWSDNSQTAGDTSGFAVRAQIFNADGTKSGAEFLVNTNTVHDQQSITIAALSDGRFVASWTDNSHTGGDTSGNAIRAQVFNPDGSASGSEFLVNTTTLNDQRSPTITELADGRIVISWMDNSETGGDISGWAVRAQIFDPREAAVTLTGLNRGDDLVGTIFGDTIKGKAGHDDLSGEGGKDRLFGGQGRDDLKGGTGNDILNGGAGADTMTGGIGNDVYVVNNVGDTVIELTGQGTDRIQSDTISLDLADYANVEHLNLRGSADLDLTGDAQNNRLTGNSGANTITGLGGNDRLDGRGGADILLAGDGRDILLGKGGADVLTGGLGRDRMAGGANADTFVFADAAESGTTVSTRDLIRDFSQSDGDLIDLSGIDARSGGGDQAFEFIGGAGFSSTKGELRYNQTATKTIVQADIDGDGNKDFSIELTGVIALVAGDFIL